MIDPRTAGIFCIGLLRVIKAVKVGYKAVYKLGSTHL